MMSSCSIQCCVRDVKTAQYKLTNTRTNVLPLAVAGTRIARSHTSIANMHVTDLTEDSACCINGCDIHSIKYASCKIANTENTTKPVAGQSTVHMYDEWTTQLAMSSAFLLKTPTPDATCISFSYVYIQEKTRGIQVPRTPTHPQKTHTHTLVFSGLDLQCMYMSMCMHYVHWKLLYEHPGNASKLLF